MSHHGLKRDKEQVCTPFGSELTAGANSDRGLVKYDRADETQLRSSSALPVVSERLSQISRTRLCYSCHVY